MADLEDVDDANWNTTVDVTKRGSITSSMCTCSISNGIHVDRGVRGDRMGHERLSTLR